MLGPLLMITTYLALPDQGESIALVPCPADNWEKPAPPGVWTEKLNIALTQEWQFRLCLHMSDILAKLAKAKTEDL